MATNYSRRDWLRLSLSSAAVLKLADLTGYVLPRTSALLSSTEFGRADFGANFVWGTACAAYQVEGAKYGGKGKDVWDTFTHTPGKVKTGENGDIACDFYHRYAEDLELLRQMNFKAFRFSIAWARLLPKGTGEINKDGIDFYHRVIDTCLSKGITPWITLFHWDLPQALEDKGGFTNREVVKWFSDYVDLCTKEYGDKVKNWMVLNEPLAVAGAGYMLGEFAPGKKGIKNFLPAVHHLTLCQAEGGRVIRRNVPQANIGTTFSCTYIDPVDDQPKNIRAARRVDAVMNRLFIEPALGLGYPVNDLPALKHLKKYFQPGDEERMEFDFDFIGVQNYFRTVARKSLFPPFLWAKEIPANERGVPVNEMNGEVSPEGFYKIIKQFAAYKGVRKMVITENGACFPDKLENGQVHDPQRTAYFEAYLGALLKAMKEGAKIDGYFVWSLTDNFEWNDGFRPRFGLIYVDYPTLNRYMKDSGKWFRDFLKQNH